MPSPRKIPPNIGVKVQIITLLIIINGQRLTCSPTCIQFDRITFFNPGRLFGDLTVEKLQRDDYQSRTRNKLVAEAFYLTGDIENYGSGFIRVRKEIGTYPTMVFAYEESGDGFLVSLW